MSTKPLKKSYIKAAQTAEALGFKRPDSPQERRNPYTGAVRLLCPEAVQLYDFITTTRHTCGVDYSRKDWDAARESFRRWPDEYFDLID